jgi:hypothetical protein
MKNVLIEKHTIKVSELLDRKLKECGIDHQAFTLVKIKTAMMSQSLDDVMFESIRSRYE